MYYVVGKRKDGTECRQEARNIAGLLLLLERAGLDPDTIEGTQRPDRLPVLLREYLEGHEVAYRVICDGIPDAALQDAERSYREALARLQAARAAYTEAEARYSRLIDELRR